MALRHSGKEPDDCSGPFEPDLRAVGFLQSWAHIELVNDEAGKYRRTVTAG